MTTCAPHTLLLLCCLAVRAALGSNAQCRPLPSCTEAPSSSDFIRDYLNTAVYDKAVSPSRSCQGNGSPTVVEAQLYMNQLGEVNQRLSQVTIGGYFRQWWKDPRLAFNSSSCFQSVVLNQNIVDANAVMWTPDLYIDNLVKQDTSSSSVLTSVSPDGTVWQSRQVLFTVKCTMTFMRLPYDRHSCPVVLASYSLDTSIVRLIPRGGVVGDGVSGAALTGTGIFSLDWSIEDGTSDFTKTGKVEVLFDGGWDYLSFNVSFQREPKYFVDNVIIPDAIFLIAGYTGFYVNPRMAPARVTIALIPILIMRTLSNSVHASLPQINTSVWLLDYLMASMFLCALFALQYAAVTFLVQLDDRRVEKLKSLRQKEAVVGRLIEGAAKQGIHPAELLHRLINPPESTAPERKLLRSSTKQGRQWDDRLRESLSPTLDDDSKQSKEPCVSVTKSVKPLDNEVEEQDCNSRDEEQELNARVATETAGDSADIGLKFTQADLTIITHTFEVFSSAGENMLKSPREIRQILASFGIYLRESDTAQIMAQFLRDQGDRTIGQNDIDDGTVRFRFGHFLLFVIAVHNYLLGVPSAFPHPFSPRLPPAEKLDMFFRWCFPVLVIVKTLAFLAAIDSYGSGV
eukprot:TRINITY_DN93554_c0_g1_i1.p1 TRINITY_DN93554_c0_g1~~TRINITY_DN93554_c0_g1_i1.p1  ORF type:complete len:627 (-),score=80.92 TRINITY_DN93554_c0_g1_i1:361-2241(-)